MLLQVVQVAIPEGGYQLEDGLSIEACRPEDLAQWLEQAESAGLGEEVLSPEQQQAEPAPASAGQLPAGMSWRELLADAVGGSDSSSTMLNLDYVPQPLQRVVPSMLSLGAGACPAFC